MKKLGLQFLFAKITNTPYISGDSIAALTEYSAFGDDGKGMLDEDDLKSATSIFVAGHRLRELLEKFGDKIVATTIVSGNSDQTFETAPTLPKSVKLFLCQSNITTTDPRIKTLPIGLENIRLGKSGRKKFHVEVQNFQITDRVLMPPMSPTNTNRVYALKHARDRPSLFDLYGNYLTESDYFQLTKKYRFIFACEGNAFDSHRLWEILYQNSFPVIISSPWSQSLKWLGLPILFVDSLQEVSHELLFAFLQSHRDFKASECPKLWIPFWDSIINGSFEDRHE
jgi:hypothetical protein